MRHSKLLAVLGVIFVFAFVSMAFAGAQDFILVNNTGADIYVVNISPSGVNDWEEDILGRDVLENGESVTVTFGLGNTALWDIQAVFQDGTSISWYEINLLEVSKVTLLGDGTATLQ